MKIFEKIITPDGCYEKEQFGGRELIDANARHYDVQIGEWKIVEEGPVCAILKARGVQTIREDASTEQENNTSENASANEGSENAAANCTSTDASKDVKTGEQIRFEVKLTANGNCWHADVPLSDFTGGQPIQLVASLCLIISQPPPTMARLSPSLSMHRREASMVSPSPALSNTTRISSTTPLSLYQRIRSSSIWPTA